MEFKKILVATDFSAHSLEALNTAISLAQTLGASIHVTHVEQVPIVPVQPLGVAPPVEFYTAARDAAARKLEKAAATVRAAGLPVESTLERGPSAAAIAELASKTDADLIVMGTRGLSGLSHVLLGSTAERTLRLAPCPVLTVKSEGD